MYPNLQELSTRNIDSNISRNEELHLLRDEVVTLLDKICDRGEHGRNVRCPASHSGRMALGGWMGG